MMRKRTCILILVSLLFGIGSVFANPTAIYTFENQGQSQQFYQLISELRCLVCQNENLAESNAALANDLKARIYLMVKQGQSSQQIKQFMVERYGNFILFRPPLIKETILLWFLPVVMLGIGILILVTIILRRKKSIAENS